MAQHLSAREVEDAAVLRPTRTALRGGATVARRRGTVMGSRVTTSKSKEAIYPMFLELSRSCAEIDTFWQRFFATMATGKFPKGVTLRDDCLIHSTRKTRSTFQLTPENRANWQTVADFFRNTCDIHSKRDWEIRRASGEAVVQLTTAQINKRIKKDHANAIPEYTLVLKARYGLTPSEMNEVDVLLRYYSSSNLFRQGDVVRAPSGAIRDIKTLIFDPTTRRFSITAEAKAPRYSTKEIYQHPVEYLTAPPFTRPVERRVDFDTELRKSLEKIYSEQVAARNRVIIPAKSIKKKPSQPTPSIAEDPIISEDDIDIEPVEETHHRHRSDDDSS